jgi:hypothetical protein
VGKGRDPIFLWISAIPAPFEPDQTGPGRPTT